jgi:23S rRNA pseudouridine2605 synthase
MEERLHKIIARAGITSRRNAEKLVAGGLVTVNGRTITELGAKADPARDHIKVNGKLLRFAPERVHVMVHKPGNVVCSVEDPEGRASLKGLLKGLRARVYPVGVLEYHAQGLVLLTNDGELTHALMRGRVAQTFWYKVKGRLSGAQLEEVGRHARVQLRLVREGANPWYEARWAEGRGRQEMEQLTETLRRLGHPVEKTRRVAYAGLELGKLPSGKARYLDEGEVRDVRRHAGLAPQPRRDERPTPFMGRKVKSA